MCLKSILVLAALTLSCGLARAQQSADEAAIRAVEAREIEGWSKYDAHQVASVFAADVTWQNPFGVRFHSRADLEEFVTGLFKRPSYRAAKESSPPTITDLRITSPTTAVVWTEEKSEGQLDQETGKPFSRHSHNLEVFTKVNGKWLITDAMIMDEIR